MKINKDLLYFITNAPYKFLKATVIIVTNFIITWYLGNKISKDFLGQYQFVLSSMGIFIIFSFPGIKEAILQSSARGYDKSLIIGTRIALKTSLLGSLSILLLSGFYYFFKGDTQLSLALLVVGFFFPFYYTLDNFSYYLTGKGKFKLEFIFYLISNIFLLLLLHLSILLSKGNIVLFTTAYFLSNTFIYLIAYLKCKQELNLQKDPELINYGWFLTKLNSVIYLTNYLDKFLVGLLISPLELATYSIAITLADKVKYLIKPILTVLYPAFSKQTIRITIKKIYFIIFFSIITTLILFTSSPILISILFPDFTDSITYARVYSIILLFLPINTILEFNNKAQKKKNIIKKVIFASRISFLLFIIPGIILFDIWGVIFAKILSHIIESLTNIFLFFYEKENYKNN